MAMKKVCLVSTVHIQPSKEWIDSLPTDIDIFIVDDSDGKVKIDKKNVRMFNYSQQQEALGDKYDYFAKHFHKSSACKNFGLWYAYNLGYEYVIVIDSDCVIRDKDFVFKHLYRMELKGWGWQNPLEWTGYFSRGFPYEERNKRIALNLGLWDGLWDINGKDRNEENSQKDNPTPKLWFVFQMVATGIIPLSGMNLCVRRNAIPALLFLPNFGEFRRHDDIMGGYIFQQIMKKAGECLTYGQPLVYHDSGVDAKKDEEEENAMNTSGMYFYKLVDKAMQEVMPCDNYRSMFAQFESAIHDSLIGTMFEPLIDSFKWWTKLYV